MMADAETQMSDTTPLVSVVITTYNRADIVPRAVRSVQNQEYDRIEIILVDDASTDATREVCTELESAHDEVTYLRNEQNQGVAYGINRGFDHASGEYLAHLGDDDEWTNELKLQKQVDTFEHGDSQLGFVTSGFFVYSESKNKIKRTVRPSRPNNLERYILKQNKIFPSSAVLIRAQAVDAVGGCDENIPRGVDSDLFRRIIFTGYNVAFLSEPLVTLYVDREDRMTAKHSLEKIDPHTEAEKKKLQKFPEKFKKYPESQSKVYEKIGSHYINRWKSSGSTEDLKQARQYLCRSLKITPISPLAVTKFVWSYIVVGLNLIGLPTTYLGKACF
jgi:glycosyltransferase involved in cell wall biosynthesis